MTIHNLIANFKNYENKQDAIILQKFFKCGKSEYGEGDQFLGIRVPITRCLIKGYEHILSPDSIISLIQSPYHEIRLAGLLLWVKQMHIAHKKKDAKIQQKIYRLYWQNVSYINNWDLVDNSARDIIGLFLYNHHWNKAVDILLKKVTINHLWTQRIAIISTYYFIQQQEYKPTLQICQALMNHPHNLIHKACGWMIREVGKRINPQIIKEFLAIYATKMPRTMLRYAIEHFEKEEKTYFMNL